MICRILSIALVTAMASLSSAASELTVSENMPELRGEYQSRFAVEAWTKRFRGDW